MWAFSEEEIQLSNIYSGQEFLEEKYKEIVPYFALNDSLSEDEFKYLQLIAREYIQKYSEYKDISDQKRNEANSILNLN